MDDQKVGLHPEGQAGLWIFRMAVPGVGQIIRGEVTVQTMLAEEALSIDTQKVMALERVHILADMLLKASETP